MSLIQKLGGVITADVRGYEDDATGSLTGIPHALIERPDYIVQHALLTYAGAQASEVPANKFDAFNSQSLAISLTLNITVRELLRRISHECNATIMYSGSTWLMRNQSQASALMDMSDVNIVRQDNGASSLTESRAGLKGLLNRFYWRAGLAANRHQWANSNELNNIASQTSYGIRAKHITLHDVYSETQALSILTWKVNRAGNPNRIILMCSTLLDFYAVEVGDKVALSSVKSSVTATCEVITIKRETSGKRNGTMHITLEEL